MTFMHLSSEEELLHHYTTAKATRFGSSSYLDDDKPWYVNNTNNVGTPPHSHHRTYTAKVSLRTSVAVTPPLPISSSSSSSSSGSSGSSGSSSSSGSNNPNKDLPIVDLSSSSAKKKDKAKKNRKKTGSYAGSFFRRQQQQHQRSYLLMEEDPLRNLTPPSPPSSTSSNSPTKVLEEEEEKEENNNSSNNDNNNNKTTTRTKTKKKQVRFGNIYRRTYRQKSPSRSERKSLWYTPKEIRDMRTATFAMNMTILGMEPHRRSLLIEAFESTGDCWRGLEHVREGLLLSKVEHRKNFVRAFLYFAYELGVRNPNALAVFSSTNSETDRLRAIQLAKQDALEACSIYYEFLTLHKDTPEAMAAERDGKRQKQKQQKQKQYYQTTTTPTKNGEPGRQQQRQRRQSKSTPRHHSERKPFQAQVYNLTLSL